MDEKEQAAEDIKKIVTNQAKKKKQSKASSKTPTNQNKVSKQQQQQQQQQQPQQQQQQQQQQQPQEPSQMTVALPLNFIEYIYNVLLIANRRSQWEPQELVPVGRSIEQLRGVLIKYGIIQPPQQQQQQQQQQHQQ